MVDWLVEDLFLDSRQIRKTESSLESRITSEVEDAINELRRLGIEGKDAKQVEEEVQLHQKDI